MVSPLDKGTFKKNDISNFRAVSILTRFSKIYKRVTKKLIDKAMDKYLSPFTSACQQNYSAQHVLIRLLDKWREGLHNNFAVGGVFMDLSKAFDCILHDLFIAKLKADGFDDDLLHYLYSYLDDRKQCVRINNEKSSLQNIISVPQGSVHKIEDIQKRDLRFMLSYYESSYEDLLKKSGNPSMNLRRT